MNHVETEDYRIAQRESVVEYLGLIDAAENLLLKSGKLTPRLAALAAEDRARLHGKLLDVSPPYQQG